jgi:5-(carboxyamino)imidazole ribonucleotide synthase
VRALVADGYVVHPHPDALEASQDRLTEKTTFGSLGIPVAEFAPVDSAGDLTDAVASIGAPAILKTRRGGYDGKGQAVLHTDAELDGAWAELGGAPLVLESLVPFDRELSVLAVRGLDGAVRCWPLVENRHEGGILRVSRAPAAGVGANLQERGEELARNLVSDLEHVGVLAVELFDVGGEVLANEIAPRVHNSGHWTIEGAETSQFENHLRAILGFTLGSTAPRGPSAMLNCIGEMPDRGAVLSIPGTHFHDYGKTARPGRKLGHVTVTAPNDDELTARLTELGNRVNRAV